MQRSFTMLCCPIHEISARRHDIKLQGQFQTWKTCLACLAFHLGKSLLHLAKTPHSEIYLVWYHLILTFQQFQKISWIYIYTHTYIYTHEFTGTCILYSINIIQYFLMAPLPAVSMERMSPTALETFHTPGVGTQLHRAAFGKTPQ